MVRINGVASARIYRPPSRESHNLFESDPKSSKVPSKQLIKSNSNNESNNSSRNSMESIFLKRAQIMESNMDLQLLVSTRTTDKEDLGTNIITDEDGQLSPTLSQATTIDGTFSPIRRLNYENQHKKQREFESKMRTIEKYGKIVHRREEIKKDPNFQKNLFNYSTKKICEKTGFGQLEPQVKAQILEVDDLLEGIYDIDEANLKRPRRIKRRETPTIDPNFGEGYVKAMTSKSIQLICELRRSRQVHENIVNHVLFSGNSNGSNGKISEHEKRQQEKIQKNIQLMKQSLSIMQNMEEDKKKQRMKKEKLRLKTCE